MERNRSYDIAKFLAIFSVIIYHVENYLIDSQIVCSFVNTFFLSIFFVMSGLLSSTSKIVKTNFIRRQICRLLLPFVSCFVVYNLFMAVLYRQPVFIQNDFADAKSGYWFLLTLFEFFCVFKCILKIINKSQSLFYKLIVLFSPFILVSFLCVFLPETIAGWLSLMSFRRYYLFFAAGFAVSNIFIVNDIYKKKWFFFSTIVYIIGSIIYVCYVQSVSSIADLSTWYIVNIAGCHFWLCLCRQFEDKFSKHIVLIIGQNTLGIYTLHFFPLRTIQYFSENGFLIMGGGKMLPLFWFCAFVVAILAIAFLMCKMVKSNKILSLIFLGQS